jgi:hypothetical protein
MVNLGLNVLMITPHFPADPPSGEPTIAVYDVINSIMGLISSPGL